MKTGWERQEEKGMVEDGSGEGILCEKVVCVCVRTFKPVVPHKAVAEVSKIGDL